jgi:hypothetical protein
MPREQNSKTASGASKGGRPKRPGQRSGPGVLQQALGGLLVQLRRGWCSGWGDEWVVQWLG